MFYFYLLKKWCLKKKYKIKKKWCLEVCESATSLHYLQEKVPEPDPISLWYQNQLLLQKLLSHPTVPETHLEKSRCGQLSNALLTVLTCTQTDTCLPLVDPTLKLLPRPAGPEAKSPSLPEITPGYFRPGASVTEANPSSWYVQPMPLGATFSQSQHECGPIQN